MIDRPFNQLRDTFKQLNAHSKELFKYVFEKSDSISLWIIGLSVGGISIFANNIGKVNDTINHHFLSAILYLLAISVTSGILYRVLYLNLYVLLSYTLDGIDIAFTRKKTMDTESFLKGNETFEQVLIVIQNGTGQNLNYQLPLYNESDDIGKKILYDSMVKYYVECVEFAKRDTELAIDFAVDTYAKFFYSTKEKYKKKLIQGQKRKYKVIRALTIILYLLYNLTFIIALFLFVASACNALPTKKMTDTVLSKSVAKLRVDKDVSLISLIANPEKYNGQLIRIEGFLNVEFEGTAVYLHKNDFDLGITNNSIWVDLSKQGITSAQFRRLNHKYVLLEGTFDASNKGHFCIYSGAITKITRSERLQSITSVVSDNTNNGRAKRR